MAKNKKKNRNNKKKNQKKEEPTESPQTAETSTEQSEPVQQEIDIHAFENRARENNEEGSKYIRDRHAAFIDAEDELRRLEDDAAQQEKTETKKLTKQFQNKTKEVDKIISDAKYPAEKKISMLYEKAVKGVKELSSYKKQQILMKKKIEELKKEVTEKKIKLETQDKQKQSLISLYEGLKEKNLEVHKEHDQALQTEEDKKRQMSSDFQKKISDISDQLQQTYDQKEQVKNRNQELRSELSKLLEEYKGMEKSFNYQIKNKSEELEKVQAEIKSKIDNSLHKLLEKEKYEKLSSQEIELDGNFKDLKKKYDEFKDQIDKRKKKEENYAQESQILEKRIKQLTADEEHYDTKKVTTKKMLDQVQITNEEMKEKIEQLKAEKAKLQGQVGK